MASRTARYKGKKSSTAVEDGFICHEEGRQPLSTGEMDIYFTGNLTNGPTKASRRKENAEDNSDIN